MQSANFKEMDVIYVDQMNEIKRWNFRFVNSVWKFTTNLPQVSSSFFLLQIFNL